jgi:hypothetical protein
MGKDMEQHDDLTACSCGGFPSVVHDLWYPDGLGKLPATTWHVVCDCGTGYWEFKMPTKEKAVEAYNVHRMTNRG